MIKVLIPPCTLTWRLKKYNSHQAKGMNWRNESTVVFNFIFEINTCFKSFGCNWSKASSWKKKKQHFVALEKSFGKQKNIWVFDTVELLPFEKMATLKIRWKLAAVSGKTLGATSNRTGSFLESLRNTSRRILKRLKTGWQKCCPRISAGESLEFWPPCPNWTNSSWTHNYGHSPGPFREHPGTMIWKTGSQLGIVPEMIPIPKGISLLVGPAVQLNLTQKRALTWWQVFKKKLLNYPPGPPQKNKKVALHKSATIPQWDYPCDNWTRLNFLTLQQLVSNSNSANLNNNINMFPKLPHSLSTKMPTFDAKRKKFRNVWRCVPNKARNPKVVLRGGENCFHSLICCDAVHMLENISSSNREKLGNILTVLPRNYMKPRFWIQQNTNFTTKFQSS